MHERWAVKNPFRTYVCTKGIYSFGVNCSFLFLSSKNEVKFKVNKKVNVNAILQWNCNLKFPAAFKKIGRKFQNPVKIVHTQVVLIFSPAFMIQNIKKRPQMKQFIMKKSNVKALDSSLALFQSADWHAHLKKLKKERKCGKNC